MHRQCRCTAGGCQLLGFPVQKQKTPKTTYAGTRKTLFWYSETLKQDCNYSVYLPASYDENNKAQAYPVIYLMHGVGGHQLNMIERFSTPDILNDLIGSGNCPSALQCSLMVTTPFITMDPALPWKRPSSMI